MAIVTVTYPPGCRELNDEIGADELVRRLKQLAHTFQQMSQADEDNSYNEYIPLALHLADECFLNSNSRDVQLLIACCIADILRIFAPEAPYKEPQQIKTIFLFLIKQLAGLKDPKDPAFKRYFYLLENIAYVKSFTMCFDLEDCNEIFMALFSLMFKIVNDEHSGKVKNFILDVLIPVITDSDFVSNELLDIILQNIVEPIKSQKKNAYALAKDLVNKTSDTLEPYIQQFFKQVLILGKRDEKLTITRNVYNLIYELHHICPSVLLLVLPQLEFKLKSTEESARLESVKLLARMFSEPGSNLAVRNKGLWQAFLGRFNDISVGIRIKCVQHTMHFLLHHPELIDDLTQTLKLRCCDISENVRHEAVLAIVSTAKKDFDIVSRSEDLLNLVKERALDKSFKIRKEAMSGLAMIYKKHLSNPSGVPEATKNAVKWIKDKILYGYYVSGMEDKLLVERLLYTCLVPYTLDTEERMKKLFLLFATIDENATKSFIEMHKNQAQVRKAVSEFVNLHRLPANEERNKTIAMRVNAISKFLPDSAKALEYMRKLSQHMIQEETMLKLMERITEQDITCKDSVEATTDILRRLGSPSTNNLYYNTIKQLLERTSSVMIDGDAVRTLIRFVDNTLTDGDIIEELELDPDLAKERGLRLLYILSFAFPHYFGNSNTIKAMLHLLRCSQEFVAPQVLYSLYYVGRCSPINDHSPDQHDTLYKICLEYIRNGTPKQAKESVKCLFTNTTKNQDVVFNSILEDVKANLNGEKNKIYLTAIVALGYLAYFLPDKFPVQIKNLVSRKIVKDLLMKDLTPARGGTETWADKDDLCLETQCKLESIKMIARWLLGLKTDEVSAQKTFRILNAIITSKGDLLESGKPNPAERAWFRLRAGCAMLKICEQPGVGDQLLPEQFYNLAKLMQDEVKEVRERFLCKLHKGFIKGVSNRSLSVNFMGLYVLAGFEEDKDLRAMAKDFMMRDIKSRRNYMKTLLLTECSSSSMAGLMPDYMLLYALGILAHDVNFTSHTDIEHLKRIRQALWFILEPLMKSEHFSFAFYQEMIHKVKISRDAVHLDNELINFKLYAICDLAIDIIISKTKKFDRKEFVGDPKIPPTYFLPASDDPMYQNMNIYLPLELQSQNMKSWGYKNAVTSASHDGSKDDLVEADGVEEELADVKRKCGDSMEVEDEVVEPRPKRGRPVQT